MPMIFTTVFTGIIRTFRTGADGKRAQTAWHVVPFAVSNSMATGRGGPEEPLVEQPPIFPPRPRRCSNIP